MEQWVEVAYDLKRNKGISWTKLPGELHKATGVKSDTSKIRDAIRSYESSKGLVTRQERSLVINISDVHIGKKTKTTDFEVLKARIKYLFRQVAAEVKDHKKRFKVNELHVNFIGDIIDNDSLYPSQPFHVDNENAGHATKQIKVAAELYRDELVKLQKDIKVTIVINAVRGNHGRVSKFTAEGNNFDVMFYNSLELAVGKNPSIKFNITSDFFNIASVENHNFLLYHGNNIRMYQNIPWYGLVQRCMRWAGSMAYDFDYLIVGHFHTCGEQEWNNHIIFMNGTSVTDDDFPVEVLGLKASNNYWLFAVEKDKGIVYRQKIDVSEA